MTFLSLMRAQKKSPKNSQRRRPLWQAPLLEALEDRALPSTLTVTKAADIVSRRISSIRRLRSTVLLLPWESSSRILPQRA